MQVGTLWANLKLNTGGFSSGLRGAAGGISDFARRAVLIGAAALSALTGAFVLAAKKSVDFARTYGTTVSRVASVTGLSVQAASRLVAVFNRFGIEGADAIKVFAMLEKNVGKLTLTTKSATKFEQAYGFSLRDASGHVKDANKLILQAADYFNNKSIPASKRAALEATLFGKSWQTMIPILQRGSKGIIELADQAAKLGLVLSKDNVNQIGQYKKSLGDLNEAWSGFRLQLGLLVMPLLAEFVRFQTNIVIPAIRAAIPAIQKVIGGIQSWVSANAPLISQLGGFITNVLGKLVSIVGGVLLKGLSTFLGLVGKVASALSSKGAVGKAISSLIGHLRDLVKVLGDKFFGDIGTLATKFSPGGLLSRGVTTVATHFDSLLQTLVKLAKKLPELPPELRGLFTAVAVGAGAFVGLQAIGVPLNEIVNTLFTILGTLVFIPAPLLLIGGALAVVGAAWATNFGGVRDLIMPLINEWLPKLQSAVGDFGKALGDIDLSGDVGVFGDLSGAVADLRVRFDESAPVIGHILEQIGGAMQTAGSIIGKVIDTVGPKVQQLADVILPFLGDAAAQLLVDIDRNFTNLGIAGQTLYDAISGIFGGLHDLIYSLTGAFVKFTLDVLKAWNDLKKGISNLASGISALVTAAIYGAISVARGIINSLIAALNQAIKLYNALPTPDLPYITPLPAQAPPTSNPNPTGSTPTPITGAPRPLQTGAWNIPAQMLALLHPGEMVLPPVAAEAFRTLAQGPGSGTPAFAPILNITVHAGPGMSSADARSVGSQILDVVADGLRTESARYGRRIRLDGG